MVQDRIQEQFAAQLREIDRALVAALDRHDDPAAHYAMMRYHLGFAQASLEPLHGEPLPRGKRLRAMMCLLIGRALGVATSAAEPLMLAAEMLHNASLIHDDIQDGDTLRWGRPTVGSLFGSAQAINVGDHLVGMAYQLLLQLRAGDIDPAQLLYILDIYNAAYLRMCEGQHLDLLYQGRLDITIAQYLDMIGRKTASVFAASAQAMALLGTCNRGAVACYRRFGEAFGMMYQICDDIRAIWTEQEHTGKQVGRDVFLRKVTLPLLYAGTSDSMAWNDVLRTLPADAQHLTSSQIAHIRHVLSTLGIAELCRRDAAQYRDQALAALSATQTVAVEHTMLATMVNTAAAAAGVPAEDGRTF